MTDEEREHLMSEIHARRGQPGIVLEWHQVEMRRRYELEWERRNEIERLAHPERLALPALVTVYEPPPAPPPPPEISKSTRAQERQRQKCEEMLANIGDEEVKALSQFLEASGRKFPKTPKALSCRILKFRLWRQEVREAEDIEFFQQHRPLETLWTLEMREHTRMSYVPLRIPDQPISEMAECSIFTGADSLPFQNSLYHLVNGMKSNRKRKMQECRNSSGSE